MRRASPIPSHRKRNNNTNSEQNPILNTDEDNRNTETSPQEKSRRRGGVLFGILSATRLMTMFEGGSNNNSSQDVESLRKRQNDYDDNIEDGDRYGSFETPTTSSVRSNRFGRRALFIILCTSLLMISIFLTLIHHSTKNNITPNQNSNNGDGNDTKPQTKLEFIPPSHESYNILSIDHISERSAHMVLYQHRITHSQFVAYIPDEDYYIEEDTNIISKVKGFLHLNTHHTHNQSGNDKVFGISFRTKPTSSNGVAHILEHSVLCGSKLYPAKDPFLHLMKSSLQTFLNAMTYSDRTVYPVSSRNGMDFKNLMRVYLDAVFRPLVVDDGGVDGKSGEWIVRQEGWRLEPTSTGKGEDDDDDELEYKGVVYSEMKGVYSSPDSLIYKVSRSLLYPNTTYQYDSGGDPLIIPTLTYKEFVDFYHRHYHPSNSQIFISGTVDDVKFGLELISSEYLAEYKEEGGSIDVASIRKETDIGIQPWVYTEPIHKKLPYATSSSEDGSMVLLSWLLSPRPFAKRDHIDVKGRMIELAWQVLDHLLLGTSSSILYRVLSESELGESVLEDGLTDIFDQFTFGVGMKGIIEEDKNSTSGKGSKVKKVEELIMETLEKIAKEGFVQDDIEASMNTIEFQLREFNTGRYPKGISIFLDILSKWNYDYHPKTALKFEEALDHLKSSVEESGSLIFQNLIRDNLLNNNHRVIVEFVPSTSLEKEQVKEEKDRLSTIKKSLTTTEYQTIITESKNLKKHQSTDDTPQVINSIPTLSLDDLDQTGIEYPIDITHNVSSSGVTLIQHDVISSSGILYVNFGLDISSIPFEDMPLIPFLCRLMTETGTDEMSDLDLDRLIGRHTGGIEVSHNVQSVVPSGSDASVIPEGGNFISMLFVTGKSTSDKAGLLFSLIYQILAKSKFDFKDKAIQILQDMINDKKSEISSSGHYQVVYRIRARYTAHNYVHEQLSGPSSLLHMEDILQQAQKDWAALLKRLDNIRDIILHQHRSGMILNLSGDSAVLTKVQPSVETFLTETIPLLGTNPNKKAPSPPLPDFASNDHPWNQPALQAMKTSSPLRDEAVAVSSLVSYVGKGGIMYGVGERVSGSSTVLSRYLQTGYLWETIRVKNGAYGAMDYFGKNSGTLVMVSYRDPNLEKTLDAFDGAADDILHELSSGLLSPENANNNDDDALTKAIIGGIGHLDGPALSPDTIGWVSLTRWLSGETAEDRQRWRKEVLGTTVGDFRRFGERLKMWRDASVAVVTSQAMIDKEGRNLTVVMTV